MQFYRSCWFNYTNWQLNKIVRNLVHALNLLNWTHLHTNRVEVPSWFKSRLLLVYNFTSVFNYPKINKINKSQKLVYNLKDKIYIYKMVFMKQRYTCIYGLIDLNCIDSLFLYILFSNVVWWRKWYQRRDQRHVLGRHPL